MPLKPSVERKALHTRRIELRGYERIDGLFDIEAHMVDTKTVPLPLTEGGEVAPGHAIHDMRVRLVIDRDLRILDVDACTDAAPYGICVGAPGTLEAVKGLQIGAGWSKAIAERLAGHKGCTHLTELLKPLATVAIQTQWGLRQSKPPSVDASGKPRKIDTCYTYASHRSVVQRLWPMHYTGEALRASDEPPQPGASSPNP